MITEWVMSAGDWRLRLRGDTPQDILDGFDIWDHVVVTSQQVDPARFSDSQLKAMSRYTGVLLELPRHGEGHDIGGLGLALHLGDPDGVGDIYETAVTNTAETFPNWIRDLLPAGGSITEGTLSSASGTLTASIQWVTPRQAIDWVCGQFSKPAASDDVEWRINPDGTLDAGTQADLYITNPAAETTPPLLVANNPGTQPNAKAVPVDDLDGQNDGYLRLLKQWVLGVGEGDTLVTGSATVASTLKDFHGNTLVRTRVTSDPAVTKTNIDQRAGWLLQARNHTHQHWVADLADFWVQGQFEVGDWVLIYDQQAKFTDTANQMDYRGDRIFPVSKRVVGMEWAVTEGMGVYLRSKAGVWTDLSDYVEWERPSTRLHIGDRPAETMLADLEGQFLAAQYTSDAAVPNKPTGLSATADTYINARGRERAWVVPSWTNPTENTDGSTLADLDQIQIRFRRNSTSEEWEVRSFDSADSGVRAIRRLDPDQVYELQAQARRLNGKVSGWTTSATVDTSHDTTAPNKPDAPEGQGVGSSGILISHTLNDSSGDNLAADVRSLRVFVSTTSPVADDANHRAGVVRVTPEMIASGDRAVKRFSHVGVGATRTNLIRGTLYYVAVKAVDDAGNLSDLSNEGSVTAGSTTLPEAPTGLNVADGGVEGNIGRLDVYWTASTSPDVTHYLIRKKRSTATQYGSARKIVDQPSVIAPVVLDNLKANRAYDVQVRSVNVHGNKSAWVGPETETPGSAHAKPEQPVVRGVGSNAIAVHHPLTLDAGGWISSDTAHILVFIDPVLTDSKPVKRAGQIKVNEAMLVDAADVSSPEIPHKRFDTTGTTTKEDLIRGTTYYVAVKTINWAGVRSDLSDVVQVVAGDFNAPAIPATFAVADGGIEGNVGTIHCSWTQVTTKDLDRYFIRWRVYTAGGTKKWSRHTVKAFDNKPGDAEVPVTEHGITDLKANRTYEFGIRSVDVHGNCSDWLASTPATIKVGKDQTPPQVPPQPTVTAKRGNLLVAFNLSTWGPANLDARLIKVYCDTNSSPTTYVGRILLDYEDLLAGDTVHKRVPIPANTAPGTRFYARGKAYDWAGNPSSA